MSELLQHKSVIIIICGIFSFCCSQVVKDPLLLVTAVIIYTETIMDGTFGLEGAEL